MNNTLLGILGFSVLCFTPPTACAKAFITGDLPRIADLGFTVERSKEGARISKVRPQSLAEQNGVTVGETVVAVNDKECSSDLECLERLRLLVGGRPVHLRLRKNGNERSITYKPPAIPLEDIAGTNSHYGVLRTSDGDQLRTIITYPTGSDNKMAAILFVEWLSCDSIELPMNVDDGWQRMLQSVASRSRMVMMRLEKSGVGDSRGRPCWELDYDTEVRHHREAFQTLKRHPLVDPSQLVIFGASMGGNIAALVAEGEQLAGLVIWGTAAKSWIEHLIEFNRRNLEFSGMDPAEINNLLERQIEFYVEYLIHKRSPQQIAVSNPALASVWKSIRGTDENLHYGRPIAFHQQAQAANWLAAFAKVKAPTLVMYGEHDWFEELDDHIDIVRTINRVTPGLAELKVIPYMDHHFSIYPTPQDAFTRSNQTINPEPAVSFLLDWLSRQGLRK